MYAFCWRSFKWKVSQLGKFIYEYAKTYTMFSFFRDVLAAKQLNNRVESLERELNLLKTQQSADFADLSDLIQSKLNLLSQRNIMRDRRTKNGVHGDNNQPGEESDSKGWTNLQPGSQINLSKI